MKIPHEDAAMCQMKVRHFYVAHRLPAGCVQRQHQRCARHHAGVKTNA